MAARDAIVYLGTEATGVELRQTDLRAGGSLVFTMGTTPGSWGRR